MDGVDFQHALVTMSNCGCHQHVSACAKTRENLLVFELDGWRT